MRFEESRIPGVFVIDLERREDERGYFARSWCADEFRAHGIDDRMCQANVSFTRRRHTLRGLHYQAEPHAEGKLVRVTRGGIFDVAVDLRPDSVSYCEWVGVELTAENGRALFVPEGCAHGFLTLGDETEVFYQMTVPYHPGSGAGVRWDDPAFGIEWPCEEPILNDRDASYEDFRR